jgi:hypothetical protein
MLARTLCALPTAQAADLAVRLNARDVARKHVYTDLSPAVRPDELWAVLRARAR